MKRCIFLSEGKNESGFQPKYQTIGGGRQKTLFAICSTFIHLDLLSNPNLTFVVIYYQTYDYRLHFQIIVRANLNVMGVVFESYLVESKQLVNEE